MRMTIFRDFCQDGPGGGVPHGPVGEKAHFGTILEANFDRLEDIWMDFDLNLGSDFALMLAPTRDA